MEICRERMCENRIEVRYCTAGLMLDEVSRVDGSSTASASNASQHDCIVDEIVQLVELSLQP